MDKKSKVFFIIFFSIIFVTTAMSFYKYFTKIIKTDDIKTIFMAVREIEDEWNLKKCLFSII